MVYDSYTELPSLQYCLFSSKSVFAEVPEWKFTYLTYCLVKSSTRDFLSGKGFEELGER